MRAKPIRIKDHYTKDWIIQNSIEILKEYDAGEITVRGLYYQLVGQMGMTNSQTHYKRVISAMISARRDRIIRFDQFEDLDRKMNSATSWEYTDLMELIDDAKSAIKNWMNIY